MMYRQPKLSRSYPETPLLLQSLLLACDQARVPARTARVGEGSARARSATAAFAPLGLRTAAGARRLTSLRLGFKISDFATKRGFGIASKIFCKVFFGAALVLACAAPFSPARAKETQDDLLFARNAFQDGFYGIALSKLDNIIKRGLEPEVLDEALLLRGETLFFQGRLPEAGLDFKRILEEFPKGRFAAHAQHWMGEVAFREDRFDEAVDAYSKSVRHFPKSEVVALSLYGLGWSYYEQGRDDEAAEAFKRIIREHSRHEVFGESQFKWAECTWFLGKYDESAYAFRQFIKKHPRSGLVPVAYFWLGENNYALGRYSQAGEDYREAVRLAGDAGEGDAEWVGKAHYGAAWAALKAGDYGEAQAQVERFMEYFAGDRLFESALFLKGVVLGEQGDHQESLQVYDELLDRFPDGAWAGHALFRKGSLELEEGDYNHALATFLELDQRAQGGLLYDGRYLIGKSYVALGMYGHAIRTLESLAGDPAVREDLRVGARALLADTFLESGRVEEALGAYDEILNQHAQHPLASMAQYRVGEIFYKQGQYEQAMTAFRNLMVNLRHAALEERAQYKLAWCNFHLGDYKTAGQLFAAVAHDYPQSPWAWDARLMAAESVFNAGDFKEALKRFRELREETEEPEEGLQTDYGIAWSLWQLGEEGHAAQIFSALVSEYRQHALTADVLFWLGQYYSDRGEWNEAQRMLKEIPLRFPQHELVPDALYASGWAFYRQGDFLSALETFKGFSARFREGPLSGDALYWTAQIEKGQGKLKESILHFQKALEVANAALKPRIQYELARSYQDSQDPDQAILEYLKVAYLYPDVTEWVTKANLQAAWLFEQGKRWSEAETIYTKLASAEGEEATVAKNRLNWIKENVNHAGETSNQKPVTR